MVHGYGKGLRYSALIARNLAMAGYECFGIDGRGQGGSEGERGYMDNQEVLLSDQWCLIMEACKKYKINQQTEPIFLWGFSMGGLISAHMINSVIG